MNVHFLKGTLEQYNNLISNDTIDNNTFYFIDNKDLYLGKIKLSFTIEELTNYAFPMAQELIIDKTQWTQENIDYKYNIEDLTITDNHFIKITMNKENKEKWSAAADVSSYNGGYVITTIDPPVEDVYVTVISQKIQKEGANI